MSVKIYDTKKRASNYCKRKNKKARKFRYSFLKLKRSEFLILKSRRKK